MAEHDPIITVTVYRDHVTAVEIDDAVSTQDRAMLLLILANRLRDLAATGHARTPDEGLPSEA